MNSGLPYRRNTTLWMLPGQNFKGIGEGISKFKVFRSPSELDGISKVHGFSGAFLTEFQRFSAFQMLLKRNSKVPGSHFVESPLGWGSVCYSTWPKNLSKANIYASEVLRHSPNNHTSPSDRYTIVNFRRRRQPYDQTKPFWISDKNYLLEVKDTLNWVDRTDDRDFISQRLNLALWT
ncbi:hypothetical protein RhiirA1_472354 [Rhizophagus irregularis]|uniref:Uncharacterized protein n=1 Tax=Rhizophagus irregularis TaxID=588596 RepID=A0A2N0R2J8_9GLOM|nr:hypothetical protein RhiirA1_472354 [Rhizophagus irregularis]